MKNNGKICNYNEAVVNPLEFSINRLVITVTNVCNLNCIYCYADGGSYGFKPDIMNDEVGKKVIDYFTSSFKSIRAIQFFGGEPSINWPCIKYICNYISDLKRNGDIDYIPEFSIITNGLDLDKNFIELIKEYNVHITFSIDGPAEIHDILRPTNNDKKSWEKVYENFHRVRQITNQIGIEATYTAEHIRKGISLANLVEYFDDVFGVSVPHIAPVTVPSDHPLNLIHYAERYEMYLKELVDITFDRLIKGKLVTNDLVSRVMK